MNLENCRKNKHKWHNILDTEPFWGDTGESVEWCPDCGSIRVFNTMDGRRIQTTLFKIPKVAKHYEQR